MTETQPNALTQEAVASAGVSREEADAGVLGKLGIDGTLFIAQLINFSIVAFVLWRWVFKPVVAKLDERTARVERGLRDADEANARLLHAEHEEADRIRDAEKRSVELLEETKRKGEAIKQEKVREAKNDVEKIVSDARLTIQNEKQQAYDALQKEIASLVIAATEKVVRNLGPKDRKRLVEDALGKLNENNV